MNGGMGDLAAIISSGDPSQVLERAAGLQVVGGIRQQTFADASNTKVIAGLLQQKAAVALARQQAAAAAAAAAKAAAEAQADAAAAKQKAVAGPADHAGRPAGPPADGSRSRWPSSARPASPGPRPRRPLGPPGWPPSGPPRPRNAGSGGGGGGWRWRWRWRRSYGTAAGGLIAVAFARAQLGKWYEWAAAGPAPVRLLRPDHAGLAARGRLPAALLGRAVRRHRHVPVSQARPGDLVFYAINTSNPGSIHHVAIYIGGGMMIEAPHTGAQVRISSIWRYGLMAYAGRP